MITLVLGGVRSGKSEVAEQLAGPGPGTYLATGLVARGDDDFADRVARHRARRPAAWATVEEPRAVPAVLARLHGPVLLDALGTWIANDLRPDIDALVDALLTRRGDTVVVSEEVGLGVHPVSEVGRLFADRLGEANRRIAEVADRCLLVVAGRVIDLPPGDLPTADASPPLRPTVSTWSSDPAATPSKPPPAPLSSPPLPPSSETAPSPSVSSAPPSLSGATAPSPSPSAAVAPGAGAWQAVSFLTAVGRSAAPSPAAFPWFPLVGALIGLVLGGVWWATEDPLGPLAAAALVVAVDLGLTGALHFDGLLDSADGLLPHLRPERRLAVMADPNVGAFAVATGATTLLLRTAALAGLGAARPLLLASLWSLSRAAMAVTALAGRYARSHGLASSFLPGAAEPSAPPAPDPGSAGSGPPPRTGPPNSGPTPTQSSPPNSNPTTTAETGSPNSGPAPTRSGRPNSGRAPVRTGSSWIAPAVVGGVLALGLALADDVRSVLAVVAAGLAAAAVAALARRRIGGFTGDTLGAGGVVAETIGLLAAVALLRP